MKTFVTVIFSFLFISIASAQLKPLPFSKNDLSVHEYFKLDTNLVEVPQLDVNRNWQAEYLGESGTQTDKTTPRKLLQKRVLNDVLLWGNDRMPVMVPHYIGSMPTYMPDEPVYFHMQVLKIEPITIPDLKSVE